ncbi:MAG: V-type ATPase 116kDa subunit family protein [Spirochaetota bacterium]|nr:V-type ATPase 116kDa subunit family protein [Spirochaetota bacterium]
MITTTSMRQLIAAVLEKDIDAATRALLRVGVIDFIDIREIPADWTSQLKSLPRSEEEDKVRDLRRKLDAYINTAGFTPAEMLGMAAGLAASSSACSVSELEAVDISSAEQSLNDLGGAIRRVRDKQKEVQDEILRLQELRRQLPQQKSISPELISGGHSYISVHVGTVPPEMRSSFEQALRDFPAVYLPGAGGGQAVGAEAGGEGIDFLITLKRDRDRAEKLLARYGWQDRSRESLQTADREQAARQQSEAGGPHQKSQLPIDKIDEKLEDLRDQQQELENNLKESIADRREELGRIWTGLRVAELSHTIRSHYRRTDRTYLFSGWLPADKQDDVSAALQLATEGRCYLEWHDPQKGGDPEVPKQVPVQMRNPRILSPFQSLVENYGIPAYGSVDPTPVVAVFYLAMFGLMFGDVGHGLVVFLIGLYGSHVNRKKGRRTMLFPLITWCGAAAMIAGSLFGSYFGTELLPPLWFDYHAVVTGHQAAGSVRSIMDVLLITIYFGITVIATGLLLNWINRIRSRDWIGLIWGNGGILVGWLYAAGTYCAFYYVGHDYRQLPAGRTLALLLGVPVLLMGAKPIIEHIRHNREHPEAGPRKISVLNMVMEWVVELLEIFSGYLSNTLSFMRVAGLGIAHVSLMVAFFQIAEMAASDGRFTIWSYLILLAGNALVIGLEGLSAGIQSLRLNYYEFFSKYFTGNGRAYSPISLRQQ